MVYGTSAIMNIIIWWGHDFVVDHYTVYAPTKSVVHPTLCATDQQLARLLFFEILVTWFSTLVEDTGSIPRILRELYGRIVNLEFESLEISVTEMYQIRS